MILTKYLYILSAIKGFTCEYFDNFPYELIREIMKLIVKLLPINVDEKNGVFTIYYDNSIFLYRIRNEKYCLEEFKCLDTKRVMLCNVFGYNNYVALTHSCKLFTIGAVNVDSSMVGYININFVFKYDIIDDYVTDFDCTKYHLYMMKNGHLFWFEHKYSIKRIKLPDGMIIKTFKCGDDHCMILTHCGSVFVSSYNEYGQLGQESDGFRYKLSKIDIPFAITISCGNNHLSATTINGVYVWGSNVNEELGFKSKHHESVPILLVGIKYIKCYMNRTIFASYDNNFYICGANILSFLKKEFNINDLDSIFNKITIPNSIYVSSNSDDYWVALYGEKMMVYKFICEAHCGFT